MRERLTDGVSATAKFGAGLTLLIYLSVGAAYFIVPSAAGLTSCKENTFSVTSMLPTSWLFWPIGVYNTVDLAQKLDLSVGEAWTERFCPAHAEAFDLLQRADGQAGAGLLDEAVRSYTKSINLYPTAKAWYGLKAAAARRHDFSLALSAYSNATALNPSRLDHYLKRDAAYEAMVAYASMKGAFDDTVAAFPCQGAR